jgi:hypothetical protein
LDAGTRTFSKITSDAPVGNAVEAEHGDRPDHLDPGRVHGHEDHGVLFVARPLRLVRSPHEDGNPATWVGRIGCVPLVAVDHIVIAVALNRRLDVGRITRGHVWLGHGKAGTYRSLEQRLQPLRFLLDSSIALEHFHIAGIGRGAIEQLGREMRPAHHLAQRGVLEIGESCTVLRCRQKQIPEAGCPRFRLEFLHDGIDLPGPECLGFVVEAALIRINMLVHEGDEAVSKATGALRQLEHGVCNFSSSISIENCTTIYILIARQLS